MDNLKQIADEASKALARLNSGKTYSSSYVVSRFEQAADKHSQDQLICNMRDVIKKQASKQIFISQNDVAELFQSMYGLSGGHTAFRDELEDLLPEKLKFVKVAYSASPIRTMEENSVEPIHKDSSLSDAFAVLFSLGNNNSFTPFSPVVSRDIEKVVINKLSKLGKPPVNVSIGEQNEHFALASAIYQDRNHKQLVIFLPVQIVNGNPKEPELMVRAGETIPLTKDNLYISIKEYSHYKKAEAQYNIKGDTGLPNIEIEKAILPVSLEKFANFETDMIKVANNFSLEQVNLGSYLVSSEIAAGLGLPSQVKVGSSDHKSIIFKAIIPAKCGKLEMSIPVEYHNGKPILPSKFAVNLDAGRDQIYDFNKAGFKDLLEQTKSSAFASSTIVRDSGPMSQMSYHQLLDRMIDGATNKDYQTSEDAIAVISNRFGEELGKKALMEYGNLLKQGSSQDEQRKEFIKLAEKRRELIRVPTSIELFSPKFLLPLSKLDFDSDGNVYPKGRVPKFNNIKDEPEAISTSKIHFS